MARRNENPLGIRKVDYQNERREMERHTSKEHVELLARGIWGITDPEAIRFATVMFAHGWNEGVRVGVDKTKARIAESLENGKLVKP